MISLGKDLKKLEWKEEKIKVKAEGLVGPVSG
jgi:hypothetical protein